MTLEMDPFSFDRYMVNRLNEFFPSELTSSFWDWTDWLSPTFTMMSTSSTPGIEEGSAGGGEMTTSTRGGEVAQRGTTGRSGAGRPGGGALQRSRMQNMLPFRIDIKESDDKCIVDAELPGLNKENVKAHLDEHNLLTIEAELPPTESTTTGGTPDKPEEQYLLRERQHGRLMRSIRLPKYVDKDKVDSSFTNGMLHLAFDKKAQERKQIPL